MNIIIDKPKQYSWEEVEVGDVVIFNTGKPYMLITQETLNRGEKCFEYNLMRLNDCTTCQWDWYESLEQLFSMFSTIDKIIKSDDVDLILKGGN